MNDDDYPSIRTKRNIREQRLLEGRAPKYKDLEMGLLPEFQDSALDLHALIDMDSPCTKESIFS